MTSPVRPGDIVKGKYRIDRVLGEGGMGVVVAAHHLALDQRVAIKFLQPAMLAVPVIVERFAREARAASKIESDHVARVTDVDALEDGTPFMVMEYLDGHDLSIVRERGQVLPVVTVVAYVLQACEAIGEAHRRGIVHRDIKPANLFVSTKSDGRSRVKVLDFGISKLGDGEATSPRVTSTEAVMGSADYMSPEQMLSTRDVDARTDIWALGVTLYELLTGRVPFPGETVVQIFALAMSKTPPPPSAFRPDVPPGLDEVILRCLAKDREARYGSVADLVAALAPCAAGAGRESVPPPIPSGGRASIAAAQTVPAGLEIQRGPSGPAGTLAGTTNLDRRDRKGTVWSFVIGAGVAVALGVGVAAFVFRGSLAPSAGPATTTSVAPTVVRPSPASPPPTVTAEVVVSAATAAPSASDVASSPVTHATAGSKPFVVPKPAAGPKPVAGPTSTAEASPVTKPQPQIHTMD